MTDPYLDLESRLPDSLYDDLIEILHHHPEGLGEYELLQRLRELDYFGFLGESPAPPQTLFHAHFLLFHALYQLQQQLQIEQSGLLEIGPLKIQLTDYQSGDNAVVQHDVLREYYLELSNLDGMTGQDIHELLASFWREYIRFDNRGAALAELGLTDPVDDSTIKQVYRKLAMEHHPDRGGDKQRLQAINAAFDCLCRARRR